ncbi:MAG: DUF808 domain-containing protein [Rubritepida sp.]|nr:DUF808 domain-containing protein [Rubritepida sp.]
MSTGLLALLDDVAAIAKVAAASLDDVALQASRAGVKAAGVVIDDAAVTPRYVVGFDPARELPIVGRIALGSLRNKLLILLPVAVALGEFAPWAITPLLMLGALYLCYEGAEKLAEMIWPHQDVAEVAPAPQTPAALEEARVAGAIRTDFILSAEIMAIALATLPETSLGMRVVVLALVGIGITVGVYGVVALIVKADDAGVAMAGSRAGILRAMGRGLVVGMPWLLRLLSTVGLAAMLWVGGGILLHGAETLGLPGPQHLVHEAGLAAGRMAGPVLAWLVEALCAGVVGVALGGLIVAAMAMVHRARAATA